jgi:hypothetical protein
MEHIFKKVKTSLTFLGALGALGRFGANIGATPVKTVVETMRSAVSRTSASGMPNGARSSRFLCGSIGSRNSRCFSRCFSGSVGGIPVKLVALKTIIAWVRMIHSSDCSSTIITMSVVNGWRVIVGEGVGVNR